jgi:hypothetical protein
MARIRSVDFLPEIFQTDANKQFLAATLDQLIQEPKFKKTQGFIGRTVGPGVNPNDKYVIEPTKTRADYQLEPGVISLDPVDTGTIKDAITYPGMNDALALQGAIASRPDRMYTSEYYTWDPFVDFDAFVNFSQYYWVPDGPAPVNVSATAIPTSQNFVVNRENGVYTFSGIVGENPPLTLVRNGNYTFQVAQNNKETENFRVGHNGVTSYVIDYQDNPTLTLVRGNTYVFTLNQLLAFPFWIKTATTTGTGEQYNSGVSRNGAVTGNVTFTVPQDAPDTLYYSCQTQSLMNGQINIINGTPGTGAKFWIQSSPGISGTNPVTPNITSREVLGVTNNGVDLGTINFNVPSKTAQDFYYNLNSIGTVDLITDIPFDNIQGARLDEFIATYGGIDGTTNLNTRTLVFSSQTSEGWGSVPAYQWYNIWQISYTVVDNITYLSLGSIQTIDALDKFSISFGTQYASTQWYKIQAGTLEQIPPLTATQDTLYYQDSTDPEIYGIIRLIDQVDSGTLYISDIIGKKNYTSPNGVVFTNGLKVKFPGDVYPASYATKSVTVTCSSTAAGLNLITCDSTAGLIVGQQVEFTGTTFGGVLTDTTYYVQSIFSDSQFKISLTKSGPAVTLTSAAGTMTGVASQAPEYYVSGVGTAIELLPVSNFITPEVITEENAQLGIFDYLTMDRASPDLNAWARSNRWFHIDVLNATGVYNDTPVILDNNYRAKRPILQFRSGIRLFNMGTEGKQPVNTIDFTETDAFSNIEGSTGYTVNGYTLVDGSRVIFAADEDANVRDKIYVVNFITPDTVDPLISQPIINLVLADDGEVLADQSTLCLSGDQVGLSFWYNGVTWTNAQQKESVQQAPLFDVFDKNGYSFSNRAIYPSSTFVGSKLFSYAEGTGNVDPILKFQLKYLTLSNVGDIVFDNNLYIDTYTYVTDNYSTTAPISSGFVYEYATRTVHERLLGWQTAVVPTTMRQQFKFVYNLAPLQLDVQVLPNSETIVPSIKVFVGSVFQDPGTYSVVTTADSTTITFNTEHIVGDVIEVEALSNQVSKLAFYQVPLNLEKNPLNNNSEYFTLGTIRSHYESICQNLTTLTGKINGPNNTRDLGDIVPYGQIILQQSAPLTLNGYFMRSEKYNIFSALEYNSREYQKFKNQLLESVTTQTIQFETAGQILDTAVAEITLGRTDSNPFYWSDMLPAGSVFTETTYTISNTTNDTFDTVQVYNYTSSNYLGMNVYLNDRILERDYEYSVATDGPRIVILEPLYSELVNGDVISIQEYSATYGTFVPNTPTKLGLYPAWRPEITTVKTTTGTQVIIKGHDGSETPIFGDIRDQVLLEFETRIYNNLKLDGNPVPLTLVDVIPGEFRETGYTQAEINSILSTSFLTYVGWNKLDYNTQDYNLSNPFTWNYSSATSKINNNENLLGAWRGINRYFYDTQQPERTPWEMLGFTVKPSWWDIEYGAGPYTNTNMNLWDDLAAGLVRDPAGSYVLPQYVRPGLTSVIPTGSEGELLAPIDTVVGTFDAQAAFRKSWSPGDGGPVEASWWNSSDYPFAAMRLLALTRPAKFFALFADRDLYRYSTEFGQYLYDGRYRLDANKIEVYGNGVSKASYIDWIVDYNRVLGEDTTVALQKDLDNLDVRLCYRMASFSDKQYIKLYTEKSSPNTLNTTLLIPDESYDLLVYKNQPFDRSLYSSVVIQVVAGGWAVFGYSTTRPYFNILTSNPVGTFRTFTVGSKVIQVPKTYTQTVTQIPYGFVFTTESALADFLLSYGKLLEQQGFTFTDIDNGYLLNWDQMVEEYLYWSQQGWSEGSLINLNPLAFRLTITKPQAVADSVLAQTAEHVIVDQNRQDLPVRDLNIIRQDNTFSIQPLTGQSLSFIDMRFTSYENMIVLQNKSLFGDLIYEPTTGARQSRLNLVAATSTEWNGSVDAQGFILNQDNVQEWTGLRTYPKGELVKYKGSYWSAATIVQPSAKFNYNDWNQSDYTFIQQGLLPNIANKADQLANSYNINSANLESDNDLLSYGLIGYRPRQYLAALNLDDVSQLNIYREFIGIKGTLLSVDLLGRANLGKEIADYTVYENWAVQRSVYGANANRSFVDLRLNRAYLTSNPSVVEIITPHQDSSADQTILLGDLWKSSFAPTTTQIFPTTTTLPTDIALPTAGYVNVNDADITVFQLTNPANLSANLSTIQVGTSIWVAKVNDYDWNIYRAQSVPGTINHVCDNLNGTSIVRFTAQHGLSVGDKLIIRFFDTEVNGVYTVMSVPDLNSVTIAFSFDAKRTVADGVGIGYTLQTMRVSQASDVLNLPYANQILPGAKVWVDNNGNGLWEVLQKQNPFTSRTILAPFLRDAGEAYGASIAQATNRTAMFVGSPNYGFNTGVSKGAVYLYVKNYGDQYTPVSPLSGQDDIFTLDVSGVRGYGNAVDAGSQTWAVAGASASLGPNGEANNGYAAVLYRDPAGGSLNTSPWVQSQLLTLPGTTSTTTPGAGEFGYSVAMSLDERWMYVGAPGLNNVYAYAQVQNTNQRISYIATGTSDTADISNDIQINNANQITVVQDGRALTLTSEYTVDAGFTTVTFVTMPPAGSQIVIFRNYSKGFNGGSTTYSLSPYLFTVNNIYSFSVTVNNVLQRPAIDYTYSAGNLVFYSAPASLASVTVTAQSYYEYVATLTASGLSSTDRFGHSVQCSTDGRQVVIGCKNATVNSLDQAGSVYVFDRNVQRFIRQDDSSNTYTVLGTPVAPISVILDNVYLTNQTNGIVGADNTFSVSGNNITIANDLAVGDVIEIETNQFVQQQIVTQDTVAEFVNFGQALDLCPYNCSLYVGAPQDDTVAWQGGSVQRSVNQARIYGSITATIKNPILTVGDTLRVNNVDCYVPAATGTVTSLQGLANNINTNAPNATATVSDGYLNISVTNTDAAPFGNKLLVSPGTIGTAFVALGFETFVFTQAIQSPYPVDFAGFGSSVSIDDTGMALVVGAPRGNLYLPNTFDYNTTTEKPDTTFDGNSTTFFSPVVQSGAVYTFDYLPGATNTLSTPGNFIFGQQVQVSEVKPYDQYGTAVSYNSGVLVGTAPGNDWDDSSANYGAAFVFENATRTPAWTAIYTQQPVVDIRLLSSVYMYDRLTGAKSEFFDFFDPLQGKILGAAAQNLDYIGGVDPASYNIGAFNNNGNSWGFEHVGEMWWDISTVRFIDPNQDNITYASRRWGQVFPGSRVDVYQWIESTQTPATYTGQGTPFNTTSYVVKTKLKNDGTFATLYYFWVRNIIDTYSPQAKTLSAYTVAQYIQDPRASGIAYIAPINASTIAIYNGVEFINAADTILSVEYDQTLTEANVHAEYELIAQGRGDAFLSENLYRKLQDSFCGVDTYGNLVPDPNLPISQRYGVQFRPRQSMFADRFAALKNYIQRANAVFSLYPLAESRTLTLLNSSDPEPSASSGLWDMRVANLEILGFQNIYAVPLGYTYLVATDSLNRGLWTIYTVETSQSDSSVRVLVLTRVQNYDTRAYWSYVNWYMPGYNSSTKVLYEVPNYAALASLDVAVGASVRVTANAQGKFEIYLRTETGWERVGLQDGTIEISATIYDYALGRFGFDVEVFDAQYFDQEPVIETRKIIQAINQELLVGDLLVERNKLLTLMFDFVLSEFVAPEWLVKTSLIDVDHKIRQLAPFQNYVRDNQDFVSEYIQEVKPYHVQVREFNLTYDGFDEFFGDTTDFDLPAYYNTSLIPAQYTSPILLPYTHSTPQAFNILSDTPADSTLWSSWPYNQWFNNYTLTVESILVTSKGSGYTEAPIVTIVNGTGDTTGYGATAVAVLNSQGQVVAVNLTDSGSNYTQTPTVVFDGGNGVSARAYPIMSNNLVRSFRTVIKYDRYQYNSSIETWSSTGTYVNGTLVRYNDRVWRANSPDGSTAVIGPTFNLEDWTLVDAATLSGVNRTMGFYVPEVNQPGLELPLLIDGVSYPGVQVWGDYFLGSAKTNLTVTCTATSSLTDQVTCNETLRMVVDAPIQFYGTTFGGIVEGTTYYINAIIDSTNFVLSTAPNGAPLPLSTATGTMVAYIPEPLDAVYASSFTDQYLGLRPTDINIDGGQFIGPYEGHAPEELVNGSEFDTLDMRVITRPGADWLENGHGFVVGTVNWVYDPAVSTTYSWANVVLHPVELIVTNATLGLELADGVNFTIDWDNENISIVSGVADGEIITISVYEVGGGNQLFRGNYIGTDVGDSVVIPVNAAEIYDVAVFHNGNITTGVTWSAYYPATVWDITSSYALQDVVIYADVYYRALQTVPVGIAITNSLYWIEYVPTTQTMVDFGTTYGANDGIALVALGVQDPQYSWSTPQTQYFVSDSQTVTTRQFTLTNSMQGTNTANLVVTRNGVRLRPPEGAQWFGDASTTTFDLPSRGGYSLSYVNPYADIQVWVDNVLQVQNYGAIVGNYYVTPYPNMQVVFWNAPADGAEILISVATEAAYRVVGTQLQIVPLINLGDVFAVTSWNDTAQQSIVTRVFQGPITEGITLNEPYDSTDFDSGTVNFDVGSFDFTVGEAIPVNDFYLGPNPVSANRLWVTLDGYRLSEGQDYTVENNYLILASGPIGTTQLMVITEFTESTVPEALEFRIFQDMRGLQTTYRMTLDTSTYLTQALSATDDVIYVKDVTNLTEPNLPDGYFGIITINGERIMYRYRDIAANTVSGLQRGTAGTAAAPHPVNAYVYDLGIGNQMAQQYQNYIVSNTTMGDGSTSVFTANDISILDNQTTDFFKQSVEVYVAGTLARTGIQAGSFVVGNTYTIADIGNTNWHTAGVPSDVIPMVGLVFIATTAGTGTGVVSDSLASYYYTVTDNEPAEVTFIVSGDLVAPADGVEVTILQRRGVTWYAPGDGTPSDGAPLQETNTEAARFLRGF